MMLGIRIFIDPADPTDAEKVHALQNAIKVEQRNAGLPPESSGKRGFIGLSFHVATIHPGNCRMA